MIGRAVLAAVLVACGMAGEATAAEMVLWYDRTDGSTYLKNASPENLWNFWSYSIVSDFGDLLPGDFDGSSGWKALEDIPSQFPDEVALANAQLGEAALKMGTVNPNSKNLTEVTLSAAGLEFSPGEMWFIGKPFTRIPIDDTGEMKPGYGFFFGGGDWQPRSTIVGAPVPEPSTLLLATLAGAGLLTYRLRLARTVFVVPVDHPSGKSTDAASQREKR